MLQDGVALRDETVTSSFVHFALIAIVTPNNVGRLLGSSTLKSRGHGHSHTQSHSQSRVCYVEVIKYSKDPHGIKDSNNEQLTTNN